MGGVVVVECDVERREIRPVLPPYPLDQFLRADPFLARLEHNRRAMGIFGTDVIALVPAHALKTCPHIGLNVLDQVTEMNRPVGIRQGAGY